MAKYVEMIAKNPEEEEIAEWMTEYLNYKCMEGEVEPPDFVSVLNQAFNLSDQSQWSEPITDFREYLRGSLLGEEK